MNFVSNIIQNSVAGFVDSGMRTAGGYAGDWLNKAGDMVESAGTSYGNSLANKFDGWGSSIGGTPKLASTATRPKGVQRSASTPAAIRSAKTVKPTAKSTTSTAVAKKPTTSKSTTSKSISTSTGTKKTISPASKPTAGKTTSTTISNRKAGDLRYTPGVVTGMAKKTSPNAGGAKYTPGVVTGASRPVVGGAKTAGPKTAVPKVGSGQGDIKFTKGVVTGMPKRGAVKV